MSTHNSSEKNLDSFTASFLLSEFRKDIRELTEEHRADRRKIEEKFDRVDEKFDKMSAKIDTNFKWLMGILLIGIILPFVKSLFM